MAVLSIKSILMNLPDIIKMITLVAQGIEFTAEYIDGRIKLSKFDKAAQVAQKTGDTSAIEAIFNQTSTDHTSHNPNP